MGIRRHRRPVFTGTNRASSAIRSGIVDADVVPVGDGRPLRRVGVQRNGGLRGPSRRRPTTARARISRRLPNCRSPDTPPWEQRWLVAQRLFTRAAGSGHRSQVHVTRGRTTWSRACHWGPGSPFSTSDHWPNWRPAEPSDFPDDIEHYLWTCQVGEEPFAVSRCARDEPPARRCASPTSSATTAITQNPRVHRSSRHGTPRDGGGVRTRGRRRTRRLS